MGPGSSVGIATSYGLDDPRFESCAARDVGLSAGSLEPPRELYSSDCLNCGGSCGQAMGRGFPVSWGMARENCDLCIAEKIKS